MFLVLNYAHLLNLEALQSKTASNMVDIYCFVRRSSPLGIIQNVGTGAVNSLLVKNDIKDDFKVVPISRNIEKEEEISV